MQNPFFALAASVFFQFSSFLLLLVGLYSPSSQLITRHPYRDIFLGVPAPGIFWDDPYYPTVCFHLSFWEGVGDSHLWFIQFHMTHESSVCRDFFCMSPQLMALLSCSCSEGCQMPSLSLKTSFKLPDFLPRSIGAGLLGHVFSCPRGLPVSQVFLGPSFPVHRGMLLMWTQLSKFPDGVASSAGV